jgi:hypothetical protein
MNFFKKILLAFFLTLTVIFVLSFFLPSDYKIIRSETYVCSPDQLYSYLIDINNLDSWFYITKSLDSTMIYKFKIDSSYGKSSLEWNGELMGQGNFEFNNLQKNELIEFKLSFQDNAVFKNGKIAIYANGSGAKLVWTDYGENGWNPVNRIFGLFIDGFLGPDMEKSLNKLKSNLGC